MHNDSEITPTLIAQSIDGRVVRLIVLLVSHLVGVLWSRFRLLCLFSSLFGLFDTLMIGVDLRLTL